MKYKTVNYILLFLLIGTFFFQTIPIPTENQQGVCIPPTEYYNPDNCVPERWIYGGTYFTSGIEQLGYENYNFLFSFFSMFVVGFVGNKLWVHKE